MRSVSGALDVSPPRMTTADLERRTATALVYAVVVLAALFAPWPTFALLVGILGVLGYFELRGLFRYRSYQPWLIGEVFVVMFVLAHAYTAVSLAALLLTTVAILVAFGRFSIIMFIGQDASGRRLPGLRVEI